MARARGNEMGANVNVSKVLRAAMCLCLAVYGSNVMAAEEKSSEESREALEHKLEDAQKRLSDAAREVAELSMSLSDALVPPPPWPPLVADHGFLGIVLSAHQGKRDDGVEIASVSPGGAAAEAGLKSGDVLVEIDGKSLAREGATDPHQKLVSHMRSVKPDQKVRVRYRRDGKTHDVELVAKPVRNHVFAFGAHGQGEQPFVGRLPDFAFFRAEGVFGSAELVAMTPKLGQYFGTDKGLLVVRAPNDSRLKLEDGDVILDIDGRVPSSPAHAFRILSSYQGGEKLKLNVMRQKKRLSFDIVVPEEEGTRFQFRRSLPVPGTPVEPAHVPGAPHPPAVVRSQTRA